MDYDNDEKLEKAYDLYDTISYYGPSLYYYRINPGVLDALYNMLYGGFGATYEDISSMADNNPNASTFREKTYSGFYSGGLWYEAKSSGTNLTVRFNDYQWDVMYLSKDKDDNVILTLWMDNELDKNQGKFGLGGYKTLSYYILTDDFQDDYSEQMYAKENE